MSDIDRVRTFWERLRFGAASRRTRSGATSFRGTSPRYNDECFGAGDSMSVSFHPRAKNGQDVRVLDLGSKRLLDGRVRNAGAPTPGCCRSHRTGPRTDSAATDVDRREPQNCASRTPSRSRFADATFDHVNCQGVVHHTPDTARAIAEIARGRFEARERRASRCTTALRSFESGRTSDGSGRGSHDEAVVSRGRGRERIFLERDPDEIVRMYDGAQNPIGRCFTKDQFRMLLEAVVRDRGDIPALFPDSQPAVHESRDSPAPGSIDTWVSCSTPRSGADRQLDGDIAAPGAVGDGPSARSAPGVP